MKSRSAPQKSVTPPQKWSWHGHTSRGECGTLEWMHAQTVADAFGLGRASSLSDPVARGELGEIRRLETDHGPFAVKRELESWSVDEAETSTAYHRVCWEAGIPTPEPLRATTGGFTAQVRGEQVRAYAWPSSPTPTPRSTRQRSARWSRGSTRCAIRGRPSRSTPGSRRRSGGRSGTACSKASRAAGAPYADQFLELVPALLEIEEILTPMRPVQTCHLELWADNLRSSGGREAQARESGEAPG
jgi:hypothetical protein